MALQEYLGMSRLTRGGAGHNDNKEGKTSYFDANMDKRFGQCLSIVEVARDERIPPIEGNIETGSTPESEEKDHFAMETDSLCRMHH
jgi:hypothetical protein